MSKKNIVVVGGGGAGANACRALSKTLDSSKYNLILINPLPYRIWLIAALRVTVSSQPELQQSAMASYDKLFINGKGKFVQGTVKSFEANKEGGGSVTLESGEKIDYYVLALTQGATWSGPPAFPRSDSGVKEHVESLHAKFSKAKDIVIVGGGAVGFELAGEIKDIFADKKVTVVHGEKRLLNAAYPEKMRKAAETSLRSRGVELILGDFVDFAETSEVDGVTTRSGKALKTADLVVQARGPRPNTEFVSASIGGASLSERGLIRVRPTLQLADHNDIFAAGDVIEWKEQKQAAKSSVHGLLVGANIQAYLTGGKLKNYKGSTEMIVLTNGKDAGLSYFDVLWGIMLGDWFARLAKSRGLLVPMFKGEQGL